LRPTRIRDKKMAKTNLKDLITVPEKLTLKDLKDASKVSGKEVLEGIAGSVTKVPDLTQTIPNPTQAMINATDAAIKAKYEQNKSILGTPVGGIKACSKGWRKQEYSKSNDNKITGAIYGNCTLLGNIYGAFLVHNDIYAKYKSMEAENGFLGYPKTDETVLGGGKGKFNHFENGSIYWTQQFGAHEIHGAAYDKWASLGWETGYLGYPKTDESKITAPDGKRGYYWHFEHGSIYCNEDKKIGPYAVHEYITAKWGTKGEYNWEQGGSKGDLGYPICDTQGVINKSVTSPLSNDFQGGRITCTWTGTGNKTYEVKNFTPLEVALQAKYWKFANCLGKPVGGIITCINNWKKQKYEKGAIYLNDTNVKNIFAYEVHGGIHQLFESMGAENNTVLGFPSSDEGDVDGDPGARINTFGNGVIYWSAKSNARSMGFQIWDKWRRLGGPSGYLGYPTRSESNLPEGKYCHFEGGSIYHNEKYYLGPFAVRKQVRDKWETEKWENGRFGWPISDTESPTLKNKFQGGTITYTGPNNWKVDIPYTHVRFVVDRVLCVKSEGSEDTIHIIGSGIHNNWEVTPIKCKLGKFKTQKQGDTTIHNNNKKGWPLCDLPIGGPGWPKGSMLNVALVSAHNGGGIIGNEKNLQDTMVNNIKSEVKKLTDKTPEAGATLGTLILPGVGTAIGFIAGKGLEKILKIAIDAVANLFKAKKDKNLGVVINTISIPDIHGESIWGKPKLSIDVLDFKAPDEKSYYYGLFGHWELVKK